MGSTTPAKLLSIQRGFVSLLFFAVKVVPGENVMEVVSIGPLKLLTGQLPEWAR